MKMYFKTIREINRLIEIILQNLQEEIIYKNHREEIIKINSRFQKRNNTKTKIKQKTEGAGAAQGHRPAG